MLKLFVLICLGVSLSQQASLPDRDWEVEFNEFKDKYNKVYADSEEELLRLKQFQESVELVEKHNKEYAEGKQTYYMEANEFADFTDEEFESQYLNLNLPETFFQNWTAEPMDVEPGFQAPDSLDWRSKGKVNPIRDQGKCGSCWAFGAVAAMESAVAIKDGKLPQLSEQNLVDCANIKFGYKSKGCSGGLPEDAMDYVIKNKGISTLSAYPYKGVQGNCGYQAKNRGAGISKYQRVRNMNANEMVNALQKGVLSVLVEARNNFKLYKGGVFTDSTCRGLTINHAVNVVGYTSDAWIVRNSWSTRWGEQGYMKVARGKNVCTIERYPTLALA